jgi:hypothetical protein
VDFVALQQQERDSFFPTTTTMDGDKKRKADAITPEEETDNVAVETPAMTAAGDAAVAEEDEAPPTATAPPPAAEEDKNDQESAMITSTQPTQQDGNSMQIDEDPMTLDKEKAEAETTPAAQGADHKQQKAEEMIIPAPPRATEETVDAVVLGLGSDARTPLDDPNDTAGKPPGEDKEGSLKPNEVIAEDETETLEVKQGEAKPSGSPSTTTEANVTADTFPVPNALPPPSANPSPEEAAPPPAASDHSTTIINNNDIKSKDDDGLVNERSDPSYQTVRYAIIENDGSPAALIKLVGLKSLYAKQLPKMPRAYIARLVFDRRHVSLAILSSDPSLRDTDEEIIGAICYRPFHEQRFAEIAFCTLLVVPVVARTVYWRVY